MKPIANAHFEIRPAQADDVAGVAACINEAFSPYIPRMGKPPGPMLWDFSQVIEGRQVSVVEPEGEIIGVLVLAETKDGFLLDVVAVHPKSQGRGIGRRLLTFAENQARAQGFDSIHLRTNVHMTENQALYTKIGYREYESRVEKEYSLVYMRKQL